MATETIIVVHPFGDYCAELTNEEVEFTEFVPWSELTETQRAKVITNQIAFDYMLTDERFIHEAGVPEEWKAYLGSGDFKHGEVEPIGLCKLSARAAEDDTNYTDYMNPVLRRISQGE